MSNFLILLVLTLVYLFSVLAVVVYSRFKQTSSVIPSIEEFFLASKNLKAIVLAFTYIASLFSAFTISGVPGLLYSQGIGGVLFLIISDLIGVLVIFYFGKSLWKISNKHKIYSPIEALSISYNSRKLGVLIAIVFLVFLIPYISLQLAGVGRFIVGFSGGELSYFWGTLLILIVVISYLFLGGMRAVAYTDFIQLISVFLGMTVGLIYFFYIKEISFFDLIPLMSEKYPSHLSIPGPNGLYSNAYFISVCVVFTGIFFQPHLLTRVMMASSEKQIHVIIFYLILGIFFISILEILYAFGGLLVYGADLDADSLLGYIFMDMRDISFTGFIISGLMMIGALGASMSTIDSLLISVGQIGTRDVAQVYLKMNENKQVLFSKFIMIIILIIAFIVCIDPPTYIANFALYSASGSMILAPTFLCMTYKNKSLQAAYFSIFSGLLTLIIIVLYKNIYGENLLGVHEGFIPFIVSSFIFFMFSVLAKTKMINF